MTTVRAHDERFRRGIGREARLVVRTDPLRELLTAFVSNWNRTRPMPLPGEARAGAGRDTLSAVEYVSSESGIQPSTIKHMLGPNPSPTTLLGTADAIVLAIDRPQAFYDGTLEVFHCKREGLVPLDD